MNQEDKLEDSAFVDRTVEAVVRVGLILTMLVLCYWIVRPFLVPIAWGIIIAVAAWPGYERLLRALHGRRSLASVAFVLIALVVLILPIIMLSGTLVQGAQTLAKGVEAGGWRIPPAPDLSTIPLVGDQIQSFWNRASTNMQGLIESLEPQLRAVGKWLVKLATDAGVGLLHFVIAIVVAAVMMAKSENAARAAHAIAFRLAGDHGHRVIDLTGAVVRSVSRGILGVALIQALLAGLGMLVAGVPGAGLWALVALLLATVQIGAFPVLVPAVIYVFYQGSTLTAVLFLIWALFVGSIDNVLKPILLGRGVSVPMIVIFIGAIGGFIAAGIIGLFVGSVVLAVGYELFNAWLDPKAGGGEPLASATASESGAARPPSAPMDGDRKQDAKPS
jgi:predicted PurR-regulated permease PerM